MSKTILKAEHINKNFFDGDQEISVLKDVNIEARANEFIAINGPSGSGKSTLLTILGGLQKPTDGSVLIDDVDLYQISDKKRNEIRFESIGFILQSSNLVPFLTVEQQFILQDKYRKTKPNYEEIDNILKDLGVDHLKNKYPNQISGGEKQRVAIGVCLYNHPKIILADEPTASLDSEKAYKVVDILKKIAKDKNNTVIMVTHDKRMLAHCDRVYEMNDGVLVEN